MSVIQSAEGLDGVRLDSRGPPAWEVEQRGQRRRQQEATPSKSRAGKFKSAIDGGILQYWTVTDQARWCGRKSVRGGLVSDGNV